MIVTFYSYKGGVGRSMALANIADLLARSGLRVLIVDFDLEAPGLEHFFPIDHDWVRGKKGLLDLLLAYKHSMSAAAPENEEQDTFRQLDRFVTTIYPVRSGGGRLDLLSAGQRRTDDQLLSYGLELRQFDWLNFYFTWSGELFFEWLRRALADRYDVVLIDSRTGVTEMGGICAYQLADVIVAFCAPKQWSGISFRRLFAGFAAIGPSTCSSCRPGSSKAIAIFARRSGSVSTTTSQLTFRAPWLMPG